MNESSPGKASVVHCSSLYLLKNVWMSLRKSQMYNTLLISLWLIFSSVNADFPTVDIVGNKFFYSNNGSQFYIRGIAYQKDTSEISEPVEFIDPLSNPSVCARDIPYLQELNTNVIRVYAIDPSLDHDECMEMLQDAGMYVIADLSSPKASIITDNPSWNLDLFKRYTSVLDELQKYDNVLGVFAGNEVITDSSNIEAAPFIKASIRDMKNYLIENNYRQIPIGYSANDFPGTRVPTALYLTSGEDDEKADFYGINMYEWCGDSTFATSGYKERTSDFSQIAVPVFFSEYGCNTIQPREFTDVETLFSSDMTDVWSGGIVYMYFQEVNDYGLVTVKDDIVTTLADFNFYSKQINRVSPTSADASQATEAPYIQSASLDDDWLDLIELPPTPDEAVCKDMFGSLSCVVDENLKPERYGDIFSYVCQQVSCDDITLNSTHFGNYSFCSAHNKLSYVLDLHYVKKDKQPWACDFAGAARLMLEEKTRRGGILSIEDHSTTV